MGRREGPLDPAAGPVQRFAFELRKLRQEAGGLTYRVMAERTRYSVATLSRAAAGEQLPSLPVVLAYVTACGGGAAEWERRWRATAEETAAGGEDEDDASGPYRGLARFEPGDRELFFGREELVAQLVDRVRAYQVVAVVGASGSGKSSLLRAGLIPALQNRAPSSQRPSALRILTPGAHPLPTHAAALTPGQRPGDTVVVIDQFEEVFTLCTDPAQRTDFLDLLLSATEPGSRLHVVIAVRADFFGRCAEHPRLAEALRQATVLVGPMGPGELREAIVKPAAAQGLIVERALTTRIVAEVAEEPGGLPLMSHALLETWRRRKGRTLTLAAYETTGGVRGALARTAEQFYGRLTAEQAETVRRIFLRLVTPGQGAQDTSCPTARAELETTGTGGASAADTALLVEKLARARLVTLDGEMVTLAHEALITAWPRLHTWIDDARDRLRLHRRLTQDARTWDELGRDDGALYRGARLSTVEDTLTRHHDELTPLERDFLHASSAHAAAERHRERTRIRRLRQLAGSLAVLLVLSIVAGTVALVQTRSAHDQSHLALSRELAARADAMLRQRPEAAMLTALAAYRQSPTAEARGSMLSAYAAFHATRLGGHDVSAMAFSSDGRTLATGGADHTVKLWDTATHQLTATLHGHTDEVAGVAFSPDGRLLASAGRDKTVKLWDVATHRELAALTGHTASVEGVAFSPDGRTLATASLDRTVRLWDIRTQRQVAVLWGKDWVYGVAFAPDGRTLASACNDHTVKLWDVSTHRQLATLTGHTDSVATVSFSPDGRTLASAAGDNTARLWDARSHRLLATFQGQRVAFSPDGHTLATAGTDRTVRLWDARSHAFVGAPLQRNGDLVAFNPQGNTLAVAATDSDGAMLWDVATRTMTTTIGGSNATPAKALFAPTHHLAAVASSDGSVTLWDLATGRSVAAFRTGAVGLSSSPTTFMHAAFALNGNTLAVGNQDGTLRLWDIRTHRQVAAVSGHTRRITAVAFSPDGRTLATASTDRTVRLWDTRSRTPRATLTGFSDFVSSLAYSPDGRTLAAGNANGTIRLTDVPSGRTVTTLTNGSSLSITDVEFSPDGITLAVASDTVTLWNVATHRPTATLTAHTALVTDLAFSPDGRTLATASADGTTRLWDTTDRHPVTTLNGHDGIVYSATFSPDGRALVTTGSDRTTRLWQLTTKEVRHRICQASKDHHWTFPLPGTPDETPTPCP
ncbi:helix-turn-helix domain-containing protein [Streptomyces sp. NPDC057743]|uniref:nSTAND1 domain-containing NTPase n=1 Tax=Streptomyces sp. NPDC057743 TaxID=3346236 RepID=UPI0036749442